MALLGWLRPFLAIWGALAVVDEIGFIFRIARLAGVGMKLMTRGGSQHGSSDGAMCAICDDVMGDVLQGTEGLQSLPCKMACLRIPACVEMCERIKSVSGNSTRFPCIAAGYCRDEDDEAPTTCAVEPGFRCVPERYCARRRRGLKLVCELKPGIGRWVGMKNTVSSHAASLAEALYNQPRCGEPGAGDFCIASPRGLGAIAERAGHILALGYGCVNSIGAIESQGGDDDRVWLTYWLVLALMSAAEQFARVLLSAFPRYYEVKLIALLWLVLRPNTSDDLYRWLRARLIASLQLVPLRLLRLPLEHLIADDASEAKAALQLVPSELREAAQLHGDSGWEDRARRTSIARQTTDDDRWDAEQVHRDWRGWGGWALHSSARAHLDRGPAWVRSCLWW